MVSPKKKSAGKSTGKRKHRHRHHNFLAAWLRSPRTIGAVVPSSRRLARVVASQIDMKKSGTVIELGPGTGVITHALLELGLPSDRLVLIERDKKFYALLTAQFSELKVVNADAAHLDQVLASLGITQVNAIVSSLPLLNMPKPVRDAIEGCMARLIGDKGAIIQFTYGPASPISREGLRQHHLAGKRVKTVLTNVPPAHVWVYQRKI
jgi:phosphatidylethanolamine/phosphatidyl-N-methylethanolamine N-methyltransferase